MCSPRKSEEKFLILTFLWIKTNIAYARLEVITKQCSALQVEFITGVKLICYFVLYYYFLHWAHPPNMAVGDLAFYYTLYLCLGYIRWGGGGGTHIYWCTHAWTFKNTYTLSKFELSPRKHSYTGISHQFTSNLTPKLTRLKNKKQTFFFFFFFFFLENQCFQTLKPKCVTGCMFYWKKKNPFSSILFCFCFVLFCFVFVFVFCFLVFCVFAHVYTIYQNVSPIRYHKVMALFSLKIFDCPLLPVQYSMFDCVIMSWKACVPS